MKNNFILFASLLGFVIACSQPTDSQPTPISADDALQTAIVSTSIAIAETSIALTPSATPTETPAPLVTDSVVLPSPTPTFAAGFTQFAQIQFVAPGPLSSLTSPFNLQAYIAAGESERIQVDLLGEDGRVLQRQLQKLTRNPKGIFQRFEFSFEIRAVSEAGYLRVSSLDDFGRIQALNTMPVLLYSVGNMQLNPPGNFVYERVSVDGLKEKAEFFGGEVYLKGIIWPFNDQPFVVELLTQEGKPISSRILSMNGIDTQAFETTLPYKVSEPTPVRLTFRQENPLLLISDDVLSRYIYVYTVEVILNP
jgi:hypothetical protein